MSDLKRWAKMKPPPYISLIQDGWIRIEGDHHKFPELQPILTRIPFGYSGVLFEENGDYFRNISLISRLIELAGFGVSFGEDYKQMWSPAELMRAFQEQGILRQEFSSISWSGPGAWSLRKNSPK
jgi:hypothetical protein